MKEFTARLEDLSLGSLDKASFKASLRLQVYFTGRTHEMLLEFGKEGQDILLKHGNDEGVLDGARGFLAQTELLRAWGDAWTEWQVEFQAARRQAAMIPFGVMAVRHERLVVAPLSSPQMAEGAQFRGRGLEEALTDGGVFDPQLRILLDVAAQFLYGDTLNLSDRIWRVDREARDGISRVLMQGIADGDSAWNMAKKLEEFLGAGEDCPRWTSTRLYGRTAADKAAGDTTGLLSGKACDGQGVSYKALRLARTEIQKAHSLATDRLLAAQPWVKMEQTNLSASHPEVDECDDVVNGGENGDGVYPVGTIEYPLHPNCFCFKTAVMTDEKQFTSDLNAWLKGGSNPEMDAYAEGLGVDVTTSLLNDPAVIALGVWLFGKALKL